MMKLSEFREFEREVKTWDMWTLNNEVERLDRAKEANCDEDEENYFSELRRDKSHILHAELTSRGVYKRTGIFLAFMGYAINRKRTR